MAAAKTSPPPKPKRHARGFQRTGGILTSQIRKAGESRGFAETRLLTHWEEIVGPDIARMTRPVKVGFTRKGGLGATLTVLCTGAVAPLVQMQLPRIREKVNAAYGYAAIARIHVTQTAPVGFGEKPAPFTPKPRDLTASESARISDSVSEVADSGLKSALESLGRNVLTKAKS